MSKARVRFDELYFLHHTRGPHHGRCYSYPCEPGYGYWVHDAWTGNAVAGPFTKLSEARAERRAMIAGHHTVAQREPRPGASQALPHGAPTLRD